MKTTETEIKGIYYSLEDDYQEEVTVKIIHKEKEPHNGVLFLLILPF